jgi:hypothetical protein
MQRPIRPLRRRVLAALLTLCLALTLALSAVALTSVFYRAAVVGTPFNRAWQVAGGAFSMEWMVRSPNGSLSGFGNPRREFLPRDASKLSLWPRYAASGTYRALVVPLWPLILVGGLLSWRLRVLFRRHSDPSLCRGCGYPRTGLATGTPCPECGRATLLARVRRVVQGLFQGPGIPAQDPRPGLSQAAMIPAGGPHR